MYESWPTFTTNTTLHGLRYVGTTSGIRRLFWVVCLLAAIGGYAFLLQDSIKTYLALPINTETSHEFPENGMKFPEVTICNLNSAVRSKVDVGYDDPRFKALNLDLPVCQFIRNISGRLTCGQALTCLYKREATYFIRGCDDTIQHHLRHAVNSSSRIFNPEEFLRHYGHSFRRMFALTCKLGETQCTSDDFDPMMSSKGLCFTFNVSKFAARVGEKASTVAFAGGDKGLSIILDAQARETTFGDWSVGFRVIVNEEGVNVNRERGFNAHPGSHVLVSLSPKKIYLLPHPYKSNCSQRNLPGHRVYSKDGCLFQCVSNTIILKCGCRPIAETGFPGVPVCSISDTECVNSLKESLRHHSCDCNSPCKETFYYPRISTSRFPNTMVEAILKNRYKVKETINYLQDNFVFLQVGFATTSYEVSVQTPAYGASNLFGDIGGNMGLLLGCSILTMVEFMDFLFMFLVYKMQSKDNKTDVEDIT